MIHPNTLPVEAVWELWKGRPEPIVWSEVYCQKFFGLQGFFTEYKYNITACKLRNILITGSAVVMLGVPCKHRQA